MNKKLITEIVIKELPDDHPDKQLSLEKLIFKYWATGRTGNTLRLNDDGYEAFIASDIQSYSYEINLEQLQSKLNITKATEFTLKIGKLLKCPWYLNPIGKKTCILIIFDSKVAMFINLHGNILDYLQLKL